MAKTYLETSDVNFCIDNNNEVIIGTTALTDRVLINAGVTGVNLGSTVEKVDFAGSISNYQFKQGFGSSINIYDMSNQIIASVISVKDKHFVFSDGSALLDYAGGSVTVGGKAISSTISGVTGAVLNTAELSLLSSNKTVTINTSGTTAATSAQETFTILSTSTYSNTITGFDFNKDKLSLGAGVTTDAISIILEGQDNKAGFTYSPDLGGHLVTLTLTGLTSEQDAELTTSSGWNAIFA